MAIKAHLGSPTIAGSQRAAPRRALRLEISGLAPDGDAANVTIHNISAAGLLIETPLDLTRGEELALDLPEAGIVGATIIWRSERLYGCAFERPLGAAALAAAQLQGLAPGAPPSGSFSLSTGGGSAEALGNRLNRLRREAGLTLADVAAVLGVSKPTVWAWEKGKARPLPERLAAIAAALGVAPEVLLDAHGPAGTTAMVIEECRTRIAEACGAAPAAVKIMVEL
ncbi:MAG TPA: helix-turn-helix domain-containing protein [Erythrobacter sp.]|nr:helix-turn-helix domain-containing protein [Erythrobacter sp.]